MVGARSQQQTILQEFISDCLEENGVVLVRLHVCTQLSRCGCVAEQPTMPRVRGWFEDEPRTQVFDGDTLDVECIVSHVHPSGDLRFQLASNDTALTGRQSGLTTGIDSDGLHTIRIEFSLEFRRSYSSTQLGLLCQVYHIGGNPSVRSDIIVTCKWRLRILTNSDTMTAKSCTCRP